MGVTLGERMDVLALDVGQLLAVLVAQVLYLLAVLVAQVAQPVLVLTGIAARALDLSVARVHPAERALGLREVLFRPLRLFTHQTPPVSAAARQSPPTRSPHLVRKGRLPNRRRLIAAGGNESGWIAAGGPASIRAQHSLNCLRGLGRRQVLGQLVVQRAVERRHRLGEEDRATLAPDGRAGARVEHPSMYRRVT